MKRYSKFYTPMVIGFRDEASLVRAVAERLRTKPIFAISSRYRAGEISVIGPSHVSEVVTLVANITEDPTTFFRAGLLAEALREHRAQRVVLLAPWIAYGRQDSVTRAGESPAGRVIGRLLSTLFDRIVTLDAHSSAFRNSFRGKLFNVLPWQRSSFLKLSDFTHLPVTCIAAPDHGARDRAQCVANAFGVPMIVIEKKRIRGNRIASRLDARESDVCGARVLLVDDIADSGETLVRAACVLYAAGAATVSACVTHAVNLAQLRRTTRKVLRRIDAFFDHATGKIHRVAIAELAQSYIRLVSK